MTSFIRGEVYYRVTYPDVGMFYPNVESVVFVGKNLSDDDAEDTWYFQFAPSYAKYGSVLNSELGDRAVCCVTERDVEDMLDLAGLISELEMAAARRHASSD